MNLFGMLGVSGSALTAERMRAEVVAANMANAETTRRPEGGPYRRQQVVFATAAQSAGLGSAGQVDAAAPRGVEIAAVVADPAPPVKRFDPNHPDADAQGYVAYPDINPVEEMVDMMGAVRSYGLNASAVQATKSMIQSSLDLGRLQG